MHRVLQCVVWGWEQEALPHWRCIEEFAQAGVLGVVPVAADCWLCHGGMHMWGRAFELVKELGKLGIDFV